MVVVVDVVDGICVVGVTGDEFDAEQGPEMELPVGQLVPNVVAAVAAVAAIVVVVVLPLLVFVPEREVSGPTADCDDVVVVA